MKKMLIASVAFLLLLGTAGLGGKARAAEKYPAKPISFIIPIGPGSDFELVVRPWLQKASDKLGKPIVIVYKPGAGHTIGYREIYAAKPDGYTIGAMLGSMLSLKLDGLYPYDYHDYTIIVPAANMYPVIVASKKTKRPFTTIQDLLGFAKSHPGEVTIATTQAGATWWVASMYFQNRVGIKFNIIPQEAGAAQAVTQVAGGHTDIGIIGLTAAKPQIDAGNVRLLATFSPHRIYDPYGYAPTLKEAGHDIVYRGSSAIMGPPKMPKEIVDILFNTFQATLDADIQKHYLANDQFLELPLSRSDETMKRLDEDRDIMRDVLSKTGLLKQK